MVFTQRGGARRAAWQLRRIQRTVGRTVSREEKLVVVVPCYILCVPPHTPLDRRVCWISCHGIFKPWHWSTYTLSVIHSESRKTKQVTMKANFIHTWSVESEFVIKNSIFPWTSELAWIWHFLRKLDYFWLFLSTLVLLQNWASVFCNQCCQYKSAQK